MHELIMKGKVKVGSKEKQGEFKAEMKKHNASVKKSELEDIIKTMLKEGVIGKREYDSKIKSINSNLHLIDEAIDNPDQLRNLEQKLGITADGVQEVHTLVDMNRKNPVGQ